MVPSTCNIHDRDVAAPPVPLADRETELIHLMSLLNPITELNKLSQAERPTQVRTLLALYRLGMTTLNKDLPLPHCKAANNPE